MAMQIFTSRLVHIIDLLPSNNYNIRIAGKPVLIK